MRLLKLHKRTANGERECPEGFLEEVDSWSEPLKKSMVASQRGGCSEEGKVCTVAAEPARLKGSS